MKKLVSILMVAILAFSCLSITAFADANSKISSAVTNVLEKVEDDFKVQIFITLYDVVDEDLVLQKTYEECGLTSETAKTKEEIDLYQKTYRNVKADMNEAHNKAVLEKMGIDDKDILFMSRLTPMIVLKATKAKVFELAQLEEVASIDLYKTPLFPQPDHLFEEIFLERYEGSIQSDTHDYDELYYHYDENGDIDWALIEQCSYNAPPWEYHRVFKGRVFMYGDDYPFSFRYGIYDVKADKFYDIINENFDYSKYDDLEEVFESFNFGYLIGDSDKDGVITVLDATLIQRYVAKLTDFNDQIIDYYDDSFAEAGFPKYISDFNCDGKRDILDATAIQKRIARVE